MPPRDATLEYKRAVRPGVSTMQRGSTRRPPPFQCINVRPPTNPVTPTSFRKQRAKRRREGMTLLRVAYFVCFTSDRPRLQPAFPTFPLPVPVSPGIRPFQMMRYLWGNHFPVVTPFISASLSPTCPSSYVTRCSSHFALSFVSSFFPRQKERTCSRRR